MVQVAQSRTGQGGAPGRAAKRSRRRSSGRCPGAPVCYCRGLCCGERGGKTEEQTERVSPRRRRSAKAASRAGVSDDPSVMRRYVPLEEEAEERPREAKKRSAS